MYSTGMYSKRMCSIKRPDTGQKYAAVFLVLLILFASAVSAVVLGHHANHLHGKDCPICEQVQAAENMTTRLVTADITVALAVLLNMILFVVLQVYEYIPVAKSPVTKKVKLLD